MIVNKRITLAINEPIMILSFQFGLAFIVMLTIDL